MTTTRYEGLDGLRVIASFGIVFLHVCMATGYPNSLEIFLKFRDFALPMMVMASFFLLTISLVRKPNGGFASFLARCLKRLWLPLFIWSFVYSLSEAFIIPVLFGFEPSRELPSLIVFFTGYRHLWFLQFIFLGSLAIYPLVYWLKGERKPMLIKLSLLCFCLSLLYGFLFYFLLKDYSDRDNFSPEFDINLRIFASQAVNYSVYIAVAVGLGLISSKLNNLFARPVFRRSVVIAAITTMPIHIWSNNVPLTREIYGIAVFLAAIQPWEKIASKTWQTLASYSYGIYILHFLPAQILWMLVVYKNYEPGGAAVLGFSLIIYLISFGAAVVIRKLFPFDWFMPLVRFNREPNSSIN